MCYPITNYIHLLLLHFLVPENRIEEYINMKISTIAQAALYRLQVAFFFWKAGERTVQDDSGWSNELFSAERMERYGSELAASHKLRRRNKPGLLLARLKENEKVLGDCCRMFSAVTALSKLERRMSPAGEWLLDNYWMVQEHIQAARRHLPEAYMKDLPQLSGGMVDGMPRVYDIALENISHADGLLDSMLLERFVEAYQTVSPLSLGELWAIPIMLRLALIENLRRVAVRVIASWHDRQLATAWAERIIEASSRGKRGILPAVAEMAASEPPLSAAFVAELARRLQGQGPALSLPLNWIEEELNESGRSIEQLVLEDTRAQAAEQVSISHSMSGLRMLSSMDWHDFVERVSIVEQVLRGDPANVYAAMTFGTRDRYRHAVERLAKKYRVPEERVARTSVKLAGQAGAEPENGRYDGTPAAHVGFYLIDNGLPALKKALADRSGVPLDEGRAITPEARGATTLPVSLYLGLALGLALLLCWPFLRMLGMGGAGAAALALCAVPAFIVTSQLTTKLVNWLACLAVKPRFMPRLDFSGGIPESSRTVVVVPSMLGDAGDVDELLERIEVHYLANRDPNVQFGLLTDFKDAREEVLERDEALLERMERGIAALNARYAEHGPEPFFFCHRPRRWSESERTWMAWERKRGKLTEFNRLLRGKGAERFLRLGGAAVTDTGLPPVQYVVTLDADTRLPRDAVRQLAGSMAHPLNLPVHDADRGHVVSGYAVMQPRVASTLTSATRSEYARLFCPDAGIDPYTRTVSDAYQDLFRQGSYIGKGIYSVDAFETALGDRFPESCILSHDLIEGCYARCGLVTDVLVYEDYPTSYSADAARHSRWIRGDWQLLPWLFPKVPVPDRTPAPAHLPADERAGRVTREKNPLSMLSRWKIADNMRRSLVPAAMLIMLFLGWFMAANPAAWTLALLAIIFSLPLLDVFQLALRKAQDIPPKRLLGIAVNTFGEHVLRMVFMLVWLPFEAWFSTAAALKTLWRMGVTRRSLLEWTPSSDAALAGAKTLPQFMRMMKAAPLAAIAGGALLMAQHGAQAGLWLASAPFLLLWLLAPAIAWKLSRPAARKVFSPNATERRFLGRLARRTWAFFDTHVGPENNWLPPDNLQEQPEPVVAHRTSPTNIGVALLAHQAAYDFGYLGAGRLLERLDNMLAVMSCLERYRGHFFNWYDTKSLEVLKPRYVSSVDSGNLMGHMLTLEVALKELAHAPVLHPRYFRGVEDTVQILSGTLPVTGDYALAWEALRDKSRSAVKKQFSSLFEAAGAMRELERAALDLRAACAPAKGSETGFWLDALVAQCSDIAGELEVFALPPEAFTCHDSKPAAASQMPGPGPAGPGGFQGQSPWRAWAEPTSEPRWLQQNENPAETFKLPTYAALAAMETDCLPQPLREKAERVRVLAADRLSLASSLGVTLRGFSDMDFTFLFDKGRNLLSIGFNLAAGQMDHSFYDLLASESRLAYFVAIARGQIPQKSWFSLGRLLNRSGGAPVLLSWTGSMFEYLMPLLVMPSYEATLLDEACRGAVKRQIAYGRETGLPWGVSESGYNVRDGSHNYQYHAFGVPGLGLKRGLEDDMVLAPYAAALALPLEPEAAVRNLTRLTEDGVAGRFGMYEAVDYTASRLPRGQKSAVVYSFMAHHQGMILLSLVTALLDRPMQRRFMEQPEFRATGLLLEERVPEAASEYAEGGREFPFTAPDAATRAAEQAHRVYRDPDMARPAVQLLSNGRFHVAASSAGGGCIRYEDVAVTRWREDPTRDNLGLFCYLRDVESGEYWSAAHQPVAAKVERYEAVFCDARAEYKVRHKDIDSHMEISVSPEDDMELRRLRLTNRGRTRRTIELTSYAEVVLVPQMADEQHPAFVKLFIQTEVHPALRAVTCSRRPRAAGEPPLCMFHAFAVHGAEAQEISYETDRARFIGRGGDLSRPAALEPGGPAHLSGTAGAVLDPIVSVRCRVTLEAGKSAVVDLFTGVAADREQCLALVSGYRDQHLADRIFDLAWTHSQVLLHQYNATIFDAQLFEDMASDLMYGNGPLRADPLLVAANTRGQSALWGQSISGDKPIVLLKVEGVSDAALVGQMVKAHAYWRAKGLCTDLVILDESHAGYRQELLDVVISSSPSVGEVQLLDRPGGIFLRFSDQISREDLVLLEASARIVLSDRKGPLSDQVTRVRAEAVLPGPLRKQDMTWWNREHDAQAADYRKPSLMLANRYGGFTPDGSEYVITLQEGEQLPAPWSNVLANRQFGTVISESGGAYTWLENAHEFRLTPWENDPVCDASGEAFYIRDDESGNYWSPTPLPRRGKGSYCTRHGFGYSVFCHVEEGIRSELKVFVAREAPVKFSVLKLYNISGRDRKLSATGYVEWVLGDLRARTGMHVVTAKDAVTGALYARNAWSNDFPGKVAFFDVNQEERFFTVDRAEFLGRNGSLREPAALSRVSLSGRSGGTGGAWEHSGFGPGAGPGAGIDACAALQVPFTLKDGESREIVFILGAAEGQEQAAALARRYTAPKSALAEQRLVVEYWRDVLGTVRVKTPDPAVDVLANGWLMYQITACRFLARSGYYQSGGAFGFRDQLQDAMAMAYAAPEILREQIMRCASRQYLEGDVQHWWHPPAGRGVRTRCSDDLLWLPLAVERYIRVTGDDGILDEFAPYLEGRPLSEGEESSYENPFTAHIAETLYRHCVRAIEHVRYGERGLPLIGGGDWNDGMDRVGIQGRGESVWLGFFLFKVLSGFIPLAEARGEEDFARQCRERCEHLRESLESHGWDGAWYRRAYFDDGTPLGSAQNEECRIDSIAQSWSVLSTAAPDWRQKKAMQSLYEHLVRKDIGIVQLLDPPFDTSGLEPGYIKGYVPGVRENGGQYTHAAVWAAMAFAALGDTARAWQLFRLINPVLHGEDMTMDTYKVEPYVMAADVYAVSPHEGRGGWTWYTGSAGWMYRLLLESLLGLKVGNGELRLAPQLPPDWEEVSLHYRHGRTGYRIQMRRAARDERQSLTLDGSARRDLRVPLADDGVEHEVVAII